MRTRTWASLAETLPAGNETVVDRLRWGIAEAGLADARKMRDAIVIVLALLGELDELMPDEPDRSAFHEIADLFQDVADFAAYGASAAIRAAGQGNA
jgi:hypothetical protein